MPIPDYQSLMLPLLKLAADNRGTSRQRYYWRTSQTISLERARTKRVAPPAALPVSLITESDGHALILRRRDWLISQTRVLQGDAARPRVTAPALGLPDKAGLKSAAHWRAVRSRTVLRENRSP